MYLFILNYSPVATLQLCHMNWCSASVKVHMAVSGCLYLVAEGTELCAQSELTTEKLSSSSYHLSMDCKMSEANSLHLAGVSPELKFSL